MKVEITGITKRLSLDDGMSSASYPERSSAYD